MNKNKQGSGFTLVELLVVMAISGIILASVGKLFISSNKMYSIQEQRVRIQQDLRASLNLMARYVRMIGLDSSGNADCPEIFTANETALYFCFDYDGDGSCSGSDAAEEVEFSFDDDDEDKLKLGYGGGGPSQLATNISTFKLSYFSGADDESKLPTPVEEDKKDDIRMVEMEICGRITGSYAGQHAQEECLSKKVNCRNMGL